MLRASSKPPPNAGPSITEITGQWICLISLNTLRKLATMSSISSEDLFSLYLRSAPAQKCPGSLLFKTTALNLWFWLISLTAVSNSDNRSIDKAFFFFGLFNYNLAILVYLSW